MTPGCLRLCRLHHYHIRRKAVNAIDEGRANDHSTQTCRGSEVGQSEWAGALRRQWQAGHHWVSSTSQPHCAPVLALAQGVGLAVAEGHRAALISGKRDMSVPWE